MKKRWLAALALAFAAGCASATQVPMDAGVDLTAGKCDPGGLFAACTEQCHVPVCVVGAATCMGTAWACDCGTITACGADMRQAD